MAIHGYDNTRSKIPAAFAAHLATRRFVSVCVTA
jgi:hypothetical protein